MKNTSSICKLCNCECELTRHHLCPQSKTKKKYSILKHDNDNILLICRQCHDFIHATFSNNILRDELNTLEKLLDNEQIKKFILWRKKHPEFKGYSKLSNTNRKLK